MDDMKRTTQVSLADRDDGKLKGLVIQNCVEIKSLLSVFVK